MKRRSFVLRCALLALIVCWLAGCRRDDPARDPAVLTFRAKYDQVKEGWTQAEVRELMGNPAEVQTHTADADESVETARGTVSVKKGETTTAWCYDVANKTYVIEFAAGDEQSRREAAVYWKNVLTYGGWRKVK